MKAIILNLDHTFKKGFFDSALHEKYFSNIRPNWPNHKNSFCAFFNEFHRKLKYLLNLIFSQSALNFKF